MAQVLAPVGGGSNNGEVVTLADGGFMVVWTHLVTDLIPITNVTDEDFTAILGRVFNANGTPRGAVFQVNETTAAGQGQPDLTLLSNGNVAVSWTDGPNLTDFDVDARVRIISATGAAVSSETDVSIETEGEQRLPQVAATGDGGFVVVWNDDEVYNRNETWVYQQYDAVGAMVGERVVLRSNVSDENAQLISLGDGAFTVVGEQGVTFVLGETYRSSNGFLQNASYGLAGESNFNPFSFEDDYISNGQGHAVALNAVGNVVALTFWERSVIENNQTSAYADGTLPYPNVTNLSRDPDSISFSSIVMGQDLPELGFYPTDGAAAAAAYLPDGNIAVAWTGVSGGTKDLPVFSVYAQLISPEGVILSDTMLIEDQNVQGGPIAPPFVSAGANGQIFVGWTGTTSRNGEGTNELLGGTYTVPRKDFSAQTNAGEEIHGTSGDDVIEVGGGNDTLYMFGGDDLWIGGSQEVPDDDRLVLGMDGDDTFAVKSQNDAYYQFAGGAGYDTLDYSLSAQGATLRNSVSGIERIIGSEFDDTGFLEVSKSSEQKLVHTGAGNDVMQVTTNWGGTWDGGAGTDVLTSGFDRSDYVITKGDGFYTIGYLYLPYQSTEPAYVQEGYTGTLRGVEQIQFADQTITLDATVSLDSGSVASSYVPAYNPTGNNEANALRGDKNPNTLTGLGGNDTLTGGGGKDMLLGGPSNDYLYGDALTVGDTGSAANQVYRLYQATLSRAPDAEGHLGWAEILSEGKQAINQVANGFVNSPEFKAVYSGLDDTGFIGLMYQNVLGRAADTAGLNGWLDVLANGGTRAGVVVGLSNSKEFTQSTLAEATSFAIKATPASWSDDVYRLYQATLARAPDAAGFEGWAKLLAGGMDLTAATGGFVNSPEFKATYGTLDNTGFVELLYQNVLGRAADTAGLNGWLTQMDGGASRAAVVRGFAQSNEFVLSSADGLKSWMKGLGTDDTLNGGGGNNVLVGGLFADVFVFNKATPSTNTIRDFEAWDALSFEGFGYTSALDVRAHLTQNASNVVFANQGTQIILEGTHLASLTDDAFGF